MDNNVKTTVSLSLPINLLEHLKRKAWAEERGGYLDLVREAIFERYPIYADDSYKCRAADRARTTNTVRSGSSDDVQTRAFDSIADFDTLKPTKGKK